MATYEVSTWNEFATAYQNISTSTTGTDTIQLISDIDCNDDIPEGLPSTLDKSFSHYGTHNIIITGAYVENNVTKNHVIRNLRTNITSPSYIFKIRSFTDSTITTNIYFRNIDFINLVLDRAFIYFDLCQYANVYFEKCSLVGRRTQSFLICENSSRKPTVKLTSCFMNIEYRGINTTQIPFNIGFDGNNSYIPPTYANFCRIKQVYTGWTVGSYFSPTIAVNPQNITHNLYMNGCYLYGTFVGTDGGFGITDNYSYAATIQNVIDADFRLVSTTSAGSTIRFVAPKGIFVNRLRKLNDDSTSYVIENYNNSGDNKAIPVPPNKMTDAQYLYNLGFDIIVPE